MPVYEYRCIANGHQFDLYQSVGAVPPACPVCGSSTRKVYSSVGIIFKGPGFHVTDYRRPAASDGQSSEKQSGEKSETKTAAGESGKSGGDAGGTPTKS